MTKTQRDRWNRLMPNNLPRWLRIYDNGGKTCDRYTVVFSGHYTHKTGGEHWVLGMSGAPFWPQGVCLHSSYRQQVDYPTYGHLGRKIKFTDLPADCQVAALGDYLYLWDLVPGDDADAQIAARKMVQARAKGN